MTEEAEFLHWAIANKERMKKRVNFRQTDGPYSPNKIFLFTLEQLITRVSV